MSSEIRKELEVQALRKVLESFESIYGLDDEQAGLLSYDGGINKDSEATEFRLSFLVAFDGGGCLNDLLSSTIFDFFPEGVVQLIKVSKISDKLFSVTVLLISELPFLLVKEVGELAASKMVLSGLVVESSLVKISRN